MAEVFVVETETIVSVTAQEQTVIVVSEEENAAELTVLESPANEITTTVQQTLLQVVAGDVYFADIEQDLITGTVKQNEFTVMTNGQTTFFIPALARRLLHVMINQIDFVADCEIMPVGSGQVTYTPPIDGYELEVGDKVFVYWTL